MVARSERELEMRGGGGGAGDERARRRQRKLFRQKVAISGPHLIVYKLFFRPDF